MTDLDFRSAVRLALPPFLTGKAASLLVGWLTVWVTSPFPGVPSWSQISHAFSNWDGESYLAISQSGYPAGSLDPHAHAAGHLWAFFPGLPIAAHIVHYVLIDTVLAGLTVNAVCELIALAYVIRLVKLERGGDDASAQTAAWFLALYPYAIFLTVFYTEAPFIAAATAALYHMRRGAEGDHAKACVFAMLATATRITGLALLLPILLERILQRRRVADWQLLLVGLVVLPVLAFMLYARHQTGDSLAWFHIEVSESYGSRGIDWPWNGLQVTWDSAKSLPADQYGFIFTLEAVFGVAGVAVVAVQWLATAWPFPRIAPSLALYSTGVLLPPICLTYWLSIPRYLMSMVPIYLLAADVLRNRESWRFGVLATSASLMAFGTFVLTSGRFLS
jgi:hypothetical protein